eukprot:gb/GECG01002380.1/.p1 GENE.gb/GECG01002380.1/~~gb/GECG01002380.1/.p1  ORF type:complete len:247 (+),score=27.99 gb/GECG01002380.1/:1-741(+)
MMRVASSSRQHLHNAAAKWRRRGGTLYFQQACSELITPSFSRRWAASSPTSLGNYEQMYQQQRYFDADSTDGVTFRSPTAKDAKSICDIVYSGTLDNNSEYAYVVFCKHFQDESIVAELDGEVIGFIKGYRPPRELHAIFVWQLGVGGKARRRGIANRMIAHLAQRLSPQGVTHVQGTVTPSNEASRKLFSDVGLAVKVTESWIKEEDFPGDAKHEAEDHFQIGPFNYDQISDVVRKLEEKATKTR